MTKQELNQRLLSFEPEIIFAGTTGGVQLIMSVGAFNNHINWSVKEGDHYIDFYSDFNAACDYFLKQN